MNELDLLQFRVELEIGKRVRLQVGRSSFDAIDRRLLARNRFRNTTNALDGVRLRVGNDGLGAEALVLFPTPLRSESADGVDFEQRLFGVVGRARFDTVVLEPYLPVLRLG